MHTVSLYEVTQGLQVVLSEPASQTSPSRVATSSALTKDVGEEAGFFSGSGFLIWLLIWLFSNILIRACEVVPRDELVCAAGPMQNNLRVSSYLIQAHGLHWEIPHNVWQRICNVNCVWLVISGAWSHRATLRRRRPESFVCLFYIFLPDAGQL